MSGLEIGVYIAVYIVIGALFTAFAALVFCVLTLVAGKVSRHLEMTGPDDWTFHEFYVRYLIIAAVFTLVTFLVMPLLGCLGLIAGMFALTAAYKRVFDADWPQALVLGAMGGTIALVLFVFMMMLVLQPLGLVEESGDEEGLGLESCEGKVGAGLVFCLERAVLEKEREPVGDSWTEQPSVVAEA